MQPLLHEPAVKICPWMTMVPLCESEKTGGFWNTSKWHGLRPFVLHASIRSAFPALPLTLKAGTSPFEMVNPPTTCAPIQFAEDAKTPTPVLDRPATPWFRCPPSLELSWPKTPEKTRCVELL